MNAIQIDPSLFNHENSIRDLYVLLYPYIHKVHLDLLLWWSIVSYCISGWIGSSWYLQMYCWWFPSDTIASSSVYSALIFLQKLHIPYLSIAYGGFDYVKQHYPERWKGEDNVYFVLQITLRMSLVVGLSPNLILQIFHYLRIQLKIHPMKQVIQTIKTPFLFFIRWNLIYNLFLPCPFSTTNQILLVPHLLLWTLLLQNPPIKSRIILFPPIQTIRISIHFK